MRIRAEHPCCKGDEQSSKATGNHSREGAFSRTNPSQNTNTVVANQLFAVSEGMTDVYFLYHFLKNLIDYDKTRAQSCCDR